MPKVPKPIFALNRQVRSKSPGLYLLQVVAITVRLKYKSTLLQLPQAKDFPGIEVNKDPLSVKLYSGQEMYDLSVLRQGKKGCASIGVDDIMVIYTPKSGERGVDTVLYTICAAECPNACDTSLGSLSTQR